MLYAILSRLHIYGLRNSLRVGSSKCYAACTHRAPVYQVPYQVRTGTRCQVAMIRTPSIWQQNAAILGPTVILGPTQYHIPRILPAGRALLYSVPSSPTNDDTWYRA